MLIDGNVDVSAKTKVIPIIIGKTVTTSKSFTKCLSSMKSRNSAGEII
jgi:hypothetical protein